MESIKESEVEEEAKESPKQHMLMEHTNNMFLQLNDFEESYSSKYTSRQPESLGLQTHTLMSE